MKVRVRMTLEAHRWFSNGDHPNDACNPMTQEGNVVRYYRNPKRAGTSVCVECNKTMHEHGWIDVGADGHTVCPGDYVIQGHLGNYFVCKHCDFDRTYQVIQP